MILGLVSDLMYVVFIYLFSAARGAPPQPPILR